MLVRMVALQTFSRLGGRVRRGQSFTTTEEHASHLVGMRLAERLEVGPSSTQAVRPSETQAPPLADVVAVGGGWFEWNGTRYRGRATAEAAKAQEA